MKWLFVTTEFPWPLAHGTWLRVYHLTRTLRQQGDDVSILAIDGDPRGDEEFARNGVVVRKVSNAAPRRMGRSRRGPGPYGYDPLLARCLAEAAQGRDTVVLVRPDALQYAHEARSAGRVVCDMVDDPVLEEGRKLCKHVDPPSWVRRVGFLLSEYRHERRFLRAVDLTTFVSEEDARAFSRRNPDVRVAFVPNGVDASYFARPDAENSLDASQPTITFLGNMAHVPNHDAAMFLAHEIAPLVRRSIPHARLVIGGCNSSEKLRSCVGANVEVIGAVEDVRPVLWQATVVMLPMRLGTGVKNKLLEAWAAGAAVVATPLVCQGVPARSGQNLLLARSAKELAHAAFRLIGDETLRRRVAANGQEVARRRLTWSRAAERLRNQVVDAGNGRRRRRRRA